MSAASVFPTPAFEGSEKRLELEWVPLGRPAPVAARGLRALSRQQITSLLDSTGCCIVSTRSCAAFDAYVLSESSLFIYETKFVIKTCGTTKTLALVPQLVQFGNDLGLAPSRCKYSRADFLFPEAQVCSSSHMHCKLSCPDMHPSQHALWHVFVVCLHWLSFGKAFTRFDVWDETVRLCYIVHCVCHFTMQLPGHGKHTNTAIVR